jgi:hypothetical protein
MTQTWRELYRTALNEQDHRKLAEAVIAAESAIFARFQELAGIAYCSKERAELNTATKDLLAIKVKKLGWPDPGK